MALELTGIENQNEFFSDHYLRTTLEADLREWVKSKREVNGSTPSWERLKRLGHPYLECSESIARVRNARERLAVQRDFTGQILETLGFIAQDSTVELEAGFLPLVSEEQLKDRPHVWVVEALDRGSTGGDVMQQTVDHSQIAQPPTNATLERLVGEAFFTEEPPRWILIISLRESVLLDRSKWSGRRVLRIRWDELYNRPTRLPTFQLVSLLLRRDSLCPDSGRMSMLDVVDQQSETHARGVSGSLKYALREAVELLGNEFLHYRRSVQSAVIPDNKAYSDKLTIECLRYMYRLLFLFNVEAQRELAYLPMKAASYRRGYSLEKLRDLELVPLKGDHSAEGYFIHESLHQLFRLVFDGRSEGDRPIVYGSGAQTFEVAPLQCNLFEPDRTPLLNSVKVRNSVWLRIIQMMSLGHEDYAGARRIRRGSRKAGRGRISYAQLGINHLGAVYEALLSYRGFIAKEDLYEVKGRKDKPDMLAPAYFVNQAALEEHYDEDERVLDTKGRLVRHPKGKFIYRLTGRAREESASYYTPESLTRCLVKYALEEVLEGKRADDILKITVCEPAMGSAAFLNEAVSQLARAYLERKCRERHETLPADRFAAELQRVKMYLADNNAFGVDLNPIAVELGGVSLWLNTLVPRGFVPWFGNQLKCGNSIVGAWRRVYAPADLQTGRWWLKTPEDIALSAPRPKGSAYHFLVGDRGMANYSNKVVRQIAGKELQSIASWKKDFTARLSAGEVALLARLSETVDKLWDRHVQDLQHLDRKTTDPFPVYPHGRRRLGDRSSTRQKERQMDRFRVPARGRNAGAYWRLKLVMDYWCALWYWPIDKVTLLPTRQEHLSDLNAILAGYSKAEDSSGRADCDELGHMDLPKLIREHPRLSIVEELAYRFRFHHWQLEFADQFASRGGFDVILGHPPLRNVTWKEMHVIADKEPRFATQRFTAPQTARLRSEWLADPANSASYLKEYAAVASEASFLKSAQNYPLLKGMQSNRYKAFVTTAWWLSAGSVGLLHPNTVFDDANGGALRRRMYPRLRRHFRFRNALNLFPDLPSSIRFSLNVLGAPRDAPSFTFISDLLHPETVAQCLQHDGLGPVPGIKTDDNEWEVAGHRSRLLQIGSRELALFARLYDKPGTPALEARLPSIHSIPLLRSLEQLSRAPERLSDTGGLYGATRMLDETEAQKADLIRRSTWYPAKAADWIVSGPHFFVGNPLFKTPNAGCSTNAAYSRLDLTHLPAAYLPRTNYAIVGGAEDFHLSSATTPWNTPFTDYYRAVLRRMIDAGSERSLIPAVLPRNVTHLSTNYGVAFRELTDLVRALQGWLTIVVDCYVKTAGKSDLTRATIASLPLMPLRRAAAARVLGLTCLTTDFRDLWNAFVSKQFVATWAKDDPRLDRHYFSSVHLPWQRQSGLRTDFERRQALIELDVLCAQELGLTLEDLCTIYRIQFPVLRANENDTWYDTMGRIVFSRKNSEGGLPRTKRTKDTMYGIKGGCSNTALGWEDIRHMKGGIVTYTYTDDTLPSGPFERTVEYHAPFDRCDREQDYAEAWHNFEREKSLGSI